MKVQIQKISVFIGLSIALLILASAKNQPLHRYDIKDINAMKLFIRYTNDRIPLVSSHRGGGEEKGFPENCLETFQHTLENTWSMIECDPRYTKDSIMVLMHDETIDRTTTGRGKVSDHTLAELKKLFLKDNHGNVTPYKIPTLDEALNWAKDKTILILDKKKISAKDRANAISKNKANLAAVVMCYNAEDARECYQTNPDVLMQSIIPTKTVLKEYEATGVPWENMFVFVSQTTPKEDDLIDELHKRNMMAIIGCSFSSDRLYLAGKIGKQELYEQYHKLLSMKADIIETNLGIFVGDALYSKYSIRGSKRQFFKVN